jgi:hypothetical protein
VVLAFHQAPEGAGIDNFNVFESADGQQILITSDDILNFSGNSRAEDHQVFFISTGLYQYFCRNTKAGAQLANHLQLS